MNIFGEQLHTSVSKSHVDSTWMIAREKRGLAFRPRTDFVGDSNTPPDPLTGEHFERPAESTPSAGR